MSSLYNLEPQPTAKVILQTTSGDIALELFAKQTPLASRSFLQHCLDGYYNGTLFHRLLPGFIIQGGDPTGTGHGGESGVADGAPFADEFHSRLKFNRRGQLGMANEGANTNASQFFLTLGATTEVQALTGKNTMFGRIEGDTIYNLMKMADADLAEEGGERPLYPTRITGTEILVNPFDDMVTRAREAPRTTAESGGRKEIKKRKKAAGKNVLSFGDEEAEGQEGEGMPLRKKTKANPQLVATDNEPDVARGATAKTTKPRRKQSTPPSETEDEITRPGSKVPPADVLPAKGSLSSESEPEPEPKRTREAGSVLEKTNAEIAALKASMRRHVNTASTTREKPKSTLEAMIPYTSTRGRKRGKAGDEKGAMDMFKAFKQKLEDMPTPDKAAPDATAALEGDILGNGHGRRSSTPPEQVEEDEEAELCDLHFIAHCQSCRSWAEHQAEGGGEDADAGADADIDIDPGWMQHTLTFAKDTLGKDLEWRRKMEEIEVIDPREKARTIREEGRKERGKQQRGQARARG